MGSLGILSISSQQLTSCWTDTYRCFEGRRATLILHASRVFGSVELAECWLAKPVRTLSELIPCEILSTDWGYKRIDAVLYQIEHCVYI